MDGRGRIWLPRVRRKQITQANNLSLLVKFSMLETLIDLPLGATVEKKFTGEARNFSDNTRGG